MVRSLVVTFSFSTAACCKVSSGLKWLQSAFMGSREHIRRAASSAKMIDKISTSATISWKSTLSAALLGPGPYLNWSSSFYRENSLIEQDRDLWSRSFSTTLNSQRSSAANDGDGMKRSNQPVSPAGSKGGGKCIRKQRDCGTNMVQSAKNYSAN